MKLVDPKYYGYQIGAYFILMKVFFAFVTWYLLWSLIHRKLDLIDDYQSLEDISGTIIDKKRKEKVGKKVHFEEDI